MILVIDCETNGLPANYQAPLDQFDNWPRAIQIAWAKYENDGRLISHFGTYIVPSGWEISPDAQAKNGISLASCQEQGILIWQALASLATDLIDADYVVGHNIEFDRSILGSEFLRAQMDDLFTGKKLICTMKQSTEYCALGLSPKGYKWPKLGELYDVLFPGEVIENEHDALADVIATARCFFELVRRDVLHVETGTNLILPEGGNLRKLAYIREVLEGLKQTKKAMLDTVLQDVLYKSITAQIAEAEGLEGQLTNNVQAEALKGYEADKQKHRDGVEIKEFDVVEPLVDSQSLVHWCKENFTPALRVDDKIFKKAAIAGGIPAHIAKVSKEARAQIAQDLSKFVSAMIIIAPDLDNDDNEVPF